MQASIFFLSQLGIAERQVLLHLMAVIQEPSGFQVTPPHQSNYDLRLKQLH